MIEISEKTYHDAMPYIAEALMLGGVVASEIEGIYEKDEIKYYTLCKEYEKRSKSTLLSIGTLKREIALRHCLGVLLAAEKDEDVKRTLLRRCAANFSELYTLAKKRSAKMYASIIDATEKMDIEKQYIPLRLGYYFLVLIHGKQFEGPVSIAEIVRIMEEDIAQRVRYNYVQYALERTVQQNFGEIKEILQKYCEVKSCADIRTYMDYIDFKENRQNHTFDAPFSVQVAIRDIYNIAGALMDVNSMSFSLLLEGRKLDKKDLQALALQIIHIQQADKRKHDSSAEIDKYAYLYTMGVVFLSMIKEYASAKKICGEHLDREILTENRTLARKTEQLRQRINELEQAAQRSRSDIEEFQKKLKDAQASPQQYAEDAQLRRELEKLRAEKRQWEQDRYDYDRLKELAYALDDPVPPASCKLPDIQKIIQQHHIFILGGHESWQQQVQRELPGLRLVSGTLHSVSPDIFQNAEYVLIFSGHMAHTVYDKVIAFLRRRKIPYGYLPQCNVELLKRRIAEIYKEDEK